MGLIEKVTFETKLVKGEEVSSALAALLRLGRRWDERVDSGKPICFVVVWSKENNGSS